MNASMRCYACGGTGLVVQRIMESPGDLINSPYPASAILGKSWALEAAAAQWEKQQAAK